MAVAYLQGGEQTTITATITELFPALWFNTKNKTPTNVKELQDFIYDYHNKNNKAYIDAQDNKAGKENISLAFSRINPTLFDEKMQNLHFLRLGVCPKIHFWPKLCTHDCLKDF